MPLASIVQRRVMEHQASWGTALAEGLRRHGFTVEIVEFGKRQPRGDFICVWGWMIGRRFAAERPTLMIERGYVGDRFSWCSAGWGGLNGRAYRPPVEDGGERWRQHFDGLLQPWRHGGEFVLVMGQVDGDAALGNVNIGQWYGQAVTAAKAIGMPVHFRPHPQSPHAPSNGLLVMNGSLDDALSKAAVAVTYNSNSGVDAALAGVPVIACDEGSMAWDVAAHGLDADVVRPDRSAWCELLAWTQWAKSEMSDGTAWDYLRGGLA